MKKLNLAVVGATGAVGQEILKVMEERNLPFSSLKLLASKRSAGKSIDFMGRTYIVEETTPESFDGVDLALFAGGPASREFGRLAQRKGTVVIDNSSTFRLDDDVPLIVPEVNGEDAKKHNGLIANPNCSTILLVGAIMPIYKHSKIKKIVVSTYQAVSGAGVAGLQELIEQSKQVLAGGEIHPDAFKYQIAFNLIPHIDVWQGEFTKEETKMIYETQKILNDDSIAITPTAVRVPVLRSHSESIYLETEDVITSEKAHELYNDSPFVVVQDDQEKNLYPMPITATGTDDIYVGRIRKDLYDDHAINLWACFDQLRKGAATNAVQIAELLLKNDWV